MQANDLRRGMAIIYNKEIHLVMDFTHYTPGNKRAFVQLTLKNIRTGKILQNKFSSTEEMDVAHLESRKMQFLYKDTNGYHFMQTEDYHTVDISEDVVGDAKNYLKENMELEIDFHDERPVTIELPKQVILKVVDSPPAIRGDSVSNNMKPATLETGMSIQVPMFIQEGTMIRVNTETGEYIGRE
ncbi:MAG: elongation factor P [Candidatus Omnitrophica bacterium]|nr:elongation factor P [Candidatus Omnitrophota bacterium]